MDFRLDNTEAASDFVALLVEDLESALPAAEASFLEVYTLFFLILLKREEFMDPVKIDTVAMPKIEVKVLCSTILEAVEAFYKDPKNLAAFEAWQKAQQEQAG